MNAISSNRRFTMQSVYLNTCRTAETHTLKSEVITSKKEDSHT